MKTLMICWENITKKDWFDNWFNKNINRNLIKNLKEPNNITGKCMNYQTQFELFLH